MLRLSFIIILIGFVSSLTLAQSPHGDKLKIDCSNCHIATTWKVIPKKIKFNHDETGFPLEGQHKNVDCQSCHTSLVFSDVKTDCFSCHKDIHQGSVGYDCARCHAPQSWIVQNINQIHEEDRFPLVGMHLNADCIQCHAQYNSLNFEVIGATCFDCHRKDYYATTAPNHAQAGFSTECQDCHSLNAVNWGAQSFNHDFFPLVGGHNIANCFACHKQGSNFSGLSTECYSCHKKDYDATTDPNHITQGFPTTCDQCHSINSWGDAKFDHSTTGFALTGQHAVISCNSCHANGYTNTPSDCYSCHKKDYDATTDPNHVTQGFPTDCSQCHSTNSWGDASFDHSTTGFALTGQHATLSCNSCHASGYTNTPSDCYSCHKKDYDGTTDPNHASAGFPTDCSQCHSTNGWSGATFDHSTTGFALTGQHATLSCNSCHANGYTNTPSDCYSCHKTDYQNTTDPNHSTAQFPTTCQDCHSTSSWSGATFDHDASYFPIYSGTHSGRWSACSDCHTNSSNYSVFSCITCHAHDQTTTDQHHQGVSGYVYQSSACYSCHPTGRAGD